ncbi:hypothetical protein FCL47_05355 [Desulfopila sp. IMCC35006]|uniref:hypothetical protein n=1 Tax=Desulfopila sp. IMCC35006 TaxID=2569542 RepID=UPI0010AD1F0C|nr:hypothetical protein [Desulfopila sp. IMCC35006]TKB27561.1 hypothetical protein FCL47_05355 [Desulfopila sp. IMCC35006]
MFFLMNRSLYDNAKRVDELLSIMLRQSGCEPSAMGDYFLIKPRGINNIQKFFHEQGPVAKFCADTKKGICPRIEEADTFVLIV